MLSCVALTGFEFVSPVLTFLFRAFKINELKTEVTNRLAMLEKRVECESYHFESLLYLLLYLMSIMGMLKSLSCIYCSAVLYYGSGETTICSYVYEE